MMKAIICMVVRISRPPLNAEEIAGTLVRFPSEKHCHGCDFERGAFRIRLQN